MITVVENQLCLINEMLLKIGNLATDSHCAEGGFPADVGVGGGEDRFDFREEISRHFNAGDVAESAEGEADDVLIGVVEVTGEGLVRAIFKFLDCVRTSSTSL